MRWRAWGRRRVPAVATLLLVLGGLSACEDESAPAADDPGATASTSAGTDESTGPAAPSETKSSRSPDGTPVADAEHAVEPPGPRTGKLVGADLLIYDQDPLSAEMVERIAGLRGVQRTERLSLASVGIENRVITLGAVDPATYRNFTPYASAELQEAWERVAGGELAIDPELGKQLQDKEGFLKLGNDEDAPAVHIGAFAPQVPRVDAVVNERWAEELGMPMGNALLVNTGIASPQQVRKPLQRIVGDEASVQILGPNLDVGDYQTAVPVGGSVAEAIGTFRYTVLGGGRIAPDPAWVSANIRTEQVPILGAVTCHRVVLPQLREALAEIQRTGLADEIHPEQYAGCYYPRFIANTTQLSLHSFGIAVDLNVPGNLRGTSGEIDRGVVAIFKKWGFAWGGDWAWTDPMHFEMNRLVRAG